MFAIAFDLQVTELEQHYGKPYNNAYVEVRKILKSFGFQWIQGSTYATDGDLSNLFSAMEKLQKIDWFCKSVRDIRAFKIEDYSDFTPKFKANI